MGALVLANPGDGARASAKRRFAVPLLLIIGWIGLFAYSAAYLTEDLPFRPQAPETGASSDASPGPRATARRVVTLDLPAESSPGDYQAADVPAPTGPSVPAATPSPAAAIARPPTAPGQASAEYVGMWGPTPAACGSSSRRRGYIPATITPDHARAGRTVCAFHDTHRAGNAWVTSAECSDRGRHWSSQVRLIVEGDHLTWSSSRGTTTYLRCSRHAG
ncbi:peptidase inhibitor family I36 protein [Methylobacterium sp. P31]